MQKHFLFVFLFLFTINSYSQNEDINWYFGDSAAISFKSGIPVLLNNCALYCADNSSTVSDSLGNLLFYTNGMTVWNKNHVVMSNGLGLLGSNNSGQCALIVKQPKSHLYYIFTNDQLNGAKGFRYSIVDIAQNAGLGAVTTKNVLLFSPCTEKVDAMYDQGSDSYWICTHTWASASFNCYNLTSAGLNSIPVVSTIGSVNDGGSPYGYNAMGQLTFSPNGTTVASGVYDNGTIELFDFNSSTGVLSNARTIAGFPYIWGIAFSPDNSKLYITQWTSNNLTQFDLNAGSISNIMASATIVGHATSTNPNYSAGYLQLAHDHKIYVARFQMNYIGVINNPNALGNLCGFVNNGVNLGSHTCQAGLSRVTFNDNMQPDFTFQNICAGGTATFQSTNTIMADSVKWNFNDPSSVFNSSSLLNPTHIFYYPGTYNVILVTYTSSNIDSVHHNVIVYPMPVINLGNDTTLCPGNLLQLSAGNIGSAYLWSTGSTNQNIIVSTTGTYTVTVNNGNCSNSDSIHVDFQPLQVNLGRDTTLCGASSFAINAGNPGCSYQWSNGDTTQIITVSASGNYFVTVTNSICSVNDSIKVIFTAPPIIDLGDDTTLCPGASIMLNAGNPGASYLWSNGATTQSITVSSEGYYSVTGTIGKCSAADTIHVSVVPKINLHQDTSLCNAAEIILNAGIASSYQWSTGSTSQSITVTEPGVYWVTAKEGNCILTDTVNISGGEFTLYIPDAFTPNNDKLNDIFEPKGEGITKYHLMIFNRWGDMIFESNNINTGWDGKFKNEQCPIGIYSWVINYSTICSGTTNTLQYGYVMLMK